MEVRGVLGLFIHQFMLSTLQVSTCTLFVALLSGCSSFDDDEFGKDIYIPAGMKVAKLGAPKSVWGKQHDSEGNVVYDLKPPSNSILDGQIDNVELPIFKGNERHKLLRHLASSCKWRVTEEHGKLFAVRREVDNEGYWISELNGYIYRPIEPSGHIQNRTVIGIDGPVFAEKFHLNEFVAQAGKIVVPIKESVNHMPMSDFVDRFGPHALEIYEESSSKGRKFTAAELRLVKNELEQLRKSKTASSNGFDKHLMPAFSTRSGKPNFAVFDSKAGGGIYFVNAFINPGESGKTYLKVFEATRNIPLSSRRVASDSLEYVGWSSNPRETFFLNSLISISEGSWSTFYPARFELWFKPTDESKPERKLLERTYKICGWQR